MSATAFVKIVLFYFCLNFAGKDNVEAQCPDTISYHTINGKQVPLLWSTSFEKTINDKYISDPPCINEKKELGTRSCNDLSWSKEPICKDIQTFNTRCPPGFTENVYYCYMVTEPGPWLPHCSVDYSTNLDYKVLSYLPDAVVNLELPAIWYPFSRNITNGFGQLLTEDLNSLLRDVNIDDVNLKRMTCLALSINSPKLEWKNCSMKLPRLCIIDPYVNNYVSSSFGIAYYEKYVSRNVLFYQVFNLVANRNYYCPKLAEPLSKYTLNKLKSNRNFPHQSTCWIGLERTKEGKYIWSSSNKEIEYTDWGIDTNFKNFLGAISVSNGSSNVTLQENFALDCAICEEDIEYESPTLTLVLLKDVSLNLTYYHPKLINNTNLASCYSNALSPTRQFWIRYGDNLYIPQYPDEYWCTINDYDGHLITSNTVLHMQEQMHEFILNVTVNHVVTVEPHLDPKLDDYGLLFNAKINDNNDYPSSESERQVRTMNINDIDQALNLMYLNFHITVNRNELSEQEQYRWLFNIVRDLPPDEVFISYGTVRAMFCPTLQHYDANANVTYIWNTTPIGSSVYSNNICIVNGELKKRACEGSFLQGGTWEVFDYICDHSNSEKVSIITEDLYNLLLGNSSNEEIISAVANLTRDPEIVTSVDVQVLTEIVERVSKKAMEVNTRLALAVVSNILDVNQTELIKAQKYNSTDRILHIIDRLVEASQLQEVYTDNVLANIIDLGLGDVSGIALIAPEINSDFTEYKIQYLTSETTQEQVSEIPNLDFAVFVPKELRQFINKNNIMDNRLVLTTFYKDSLFNDLTKTVNVSGKTVSVLLPGLPSDLEIAIEVWFRNKQPKNISQCSFWRYGLDTDGKPLQGTWFKESKSHTNEPQMISVCYFNHVTHFGLLIGDEVLDEIHVTILTTLTAIGCSLSALGILAIFATAIFFKTWRNDKGHQILLQFSLAVILQYVFFYVASYTSPGYGMCVFVGCVLNYVVLAQFCWMFIIALLQYRRFVVVFGAEPTNLLLKATAVGWILPLLPVVFMACTSLDNFVRSSICYPKGVGLWVGVLLPISLIIVANVVIFVKIILSMPNAHNVTSTNSKDNLMPAIVRLAAFLFFTLGISWIFGLAAALGGGIVFAYLFCIAATLQGVVLFLYFIVLNENTKRLWYKLMNIVKFDKSKGFSGNERSTSNTGPIISDSAVTNLSYTNIRDSKNL